MSDAVNAETRGTEIQRLNLSGYLRDENNGLVYFYCIATLPELLTVSCQLHWAPHVSWGSGDVGTLLFERDRSLRDRASPGIF